MVELAHPPALKRVRAFKASPERKSLFLAVAVVVYSYVLPQAYMTAGDPRRTAIAQLEALEAAKPPEARQEGVWIGGKLLNPEDEATITEDEEFAPMPKGDLDIKSKENDPAPEPAKDDWRKAFEGVKVETEIKDEEGRSLPSEWLPSAFACAALFLSLTCTALFFLLCHWLVGFKAWALFSPIADTDSVAAGIFLLVEPVKHRGKAAIVRVVTDSRGGLGVVFQRQKYDYLGPGAQGLREHLDAGRLVGPNVGGGGSAEPHNVGALVLITCPVDRPVGHYVNFRGLTATTCAQRVEQFGRNVLRIPTPKIADLMKQQLTAPLAIFQIFCAVLWMLDEYWQYTLFTLFSIVALEATTCFQRLKTFSTLGGMANKPTPLMVLRDGTWRVLTTEDLLPGDLVSLTRNITTAAPQQQAPHNPAKNQTTGGGSGAVGAAAPPPSPPSQQRPARVNDVVPCDLLLLAGSAVVNEASLTGESVPQMKDALTYGDSAEEELRSLDIEGRDRVHTLYSGTNIIALTGASGGSSSSSSSSEEEGGGGGASGSGGRGGIRTPDGGCLCYVLRTGFSSSQGELMQMIEFSTEQVSADSKETGLALLVLLCFALASAGYVLKKGLEKGDRTTHELLLKCVIIITSVVPRQLPVQMAMAVNTALMALMKAGIFCTEPYRVPFAGKISHCLFDKTGTLTTDQLVPVGVVNNDSGGAAAVAKAGAGPGRVAVYKARPEAALVLAACHALVELTQEGTSPQQAPTPPPTEKSKVIGDPIEIAALKGVEWTYDAKTQVAVPGCFHDLERALSVLAKEQASLKEGGDPAQVAKSKGFQQNAQRIADLEVLLKASKARAAAQAVESVRITHRHHFSSELQRMSVVCQVRTKNNSKGAGAAAGVGVSGGQFCLVKGSPEALAPLLAPGATPPWYWKSYQALSEEGMRVLALAYRRVDDDADSLEADGGAAGGGGAGKKSKPEENRGWVESSLSFAGFIAFTCKTRADSPTVVRALLESAHKVAMLTGDAPLTALKVAHDIGLCTKPGPPLTLRLRPTPTLALLGGGGQEEGGEEEEDTVGAASFSSPPTFEWVGILAKHSDPDSEEYVEPTPLVVPLLKELSQQHDLVVLESVMEQASAAFHAAAAAELASKATGKGGAQASSLPQAASVVAAAAVAAADEVSSQPCEAGDVYSQVEAVRVFARCSPQGKAKVIRALQRNDSENHVLMCGDGGNDVGALKQADIGLALLSGYGNANTANTPDAAASDEGATEEGEKEGDGGSGAMVAAGGGGANNAQLTKRGGGKGSSSSSSSSSAEDELNSQSKLAAKRAAEAGKLRKALLAAKQKELMAKQPALLQAELEAMKARTGEDPGMMGMVSAVKTVTMKIKSEMDKEMRDLNRKHGSVFDAAASDSDAKGGGGADPLAGLQDEGTLPVVRPGDASVAAPFTSRTPSVRSVVTLIRQGRCTLLSALQQQQIMMLECIISAYALSALSLEGARSSERQMMASGWLIMTASLAFSYTKHVEEMHPVRPLRRLFHPAVFLSMLGQASIHVFCMGFGVHMAKEAMGPDALKAVLDFHKAAKAKELPEQQNSEDDPWAEMKSMWMKPFKPNLLNTVVFLVETSQMIAVLFVNYKGRPWMKGILENHPLFLSVFLCVAGVAGCAWGVRPEINGLLHLEAFPDDEFRWKVLGLVSLSLVGTFVWDRVVTALFAPDIFAAMVAEAKRTTWKDVLPVFETLGKVVVGCVVLANGNVLMLGGIAWYYYKKRQEANTA